MATLHLKKNRYGIILEYGKNKIALDTGREGMYTLLSHSHMDHVGDISRSDQIIATRATFDSYLARVGKLQNNTINIDYNKTISRKGIEITAYNAGHVIGSTMFFLQFKDGLTILYTGDFNVVDSIVHSAALPIHADVLVTEATYGAPEWKFPLRKNTHQNIIEEVKRSQDEEEVLFLKAYSLGKAQETIALLENAGYNVISGNRSIDAVCEVYNKYGTKMNYYTLESRSVKELLEQGSPIVSSSPVHTRLTIRRILGKEYADSIDGKSKQFWLSGWTLGRFAPKGFPLSAHSDFRGLTEFVKKVNPRIVYCFTDNAHTFSAHLSELKINAIPLE
jgi:Cft2 family RNA processing exonuclease